MAHTPPAPHDSPASGRTSNDPYIAWRSSSFRFFAVGWFLLVFGKMIETVALGVYIYDRTRSPWALGFLGLVQALPVMVLALPAGQLADWLDRRIVMLATMSVSVLMAVGLTVAAAWHVSMGWIYGLLLVNASAAALGGPARSALLPRTVADEHFSNAITWSSSVFQIASMTGPAVGGLLVGATKNMPMAFGAVVVCRVLAVAAISLLRVRPAPPDDRPVSLADLGAGIRFVWRNKLILAPISLDLFAVLLGGATYLLPIYAEDILHVGAQGLGFLRSAEAVGAVCMAVAIAHLPPMRRAGRTMLWAVAGFGAATVVYGLSRNFWLSMGMMFLIGALDNVSVVVRHTLVQMLTPDSMRGRVSAVNNVFIVASNDLGGLESGTLAGLVGPVVAVVAGGIGTILVVLASARIWPEILSLGSLQGIRPIEAVARDEQAEEEFAGRG